MRNLEFIAAPEREALARAARAAFMEHTATWSFSITPVSSQKAASDAFFGKANAYACDARFAHEAFLASDQANSTGELSQGVDVLFDQRSCMAGSFLLPQASIDELERSACAINGASVVVFGSGSFALALAYECARAGVSEVVVVDSDAKRAEENLDAFLGTFSELRRSVADMRQSTPGHLSFKNAHDKVAFFYGTYKGCVQRASKADVLIDASDDGVPADFLASLSFAHCPLVLDPLHAAGKGILASLASLAGSSVLAGEACHIAWGELMAQSLVESTRAFG